MGHKRHKKAFFGIPFFSAFLMVERPPNGENGPKKQCTQSEPVLQINDGPRIRSTPSHYSASLNRVLKMSALKRLLYLNSQRYRAEDIWR
jgi:hypothetical protein